MRHSDSPKSRRYTAMGALLAAILPLAAAPCGAQGSPNYVLTVAGGGPLLQTGGAFSVSLDSFAGNLSGWFLGVCHDEAALELLSVENGSTTLTVLNGGPADFILNAITAGGYTQLVIICPLLNCATLPPGQDYELTIGHYAPMPGTSGSTDICPCDGIGSPPITTSVVVSGNGIPPTALCGQVEIAPQSDIFVRGDANDDGTVNIADPIWLLSELFSGGPHTDCAGANDANSDGTLDIADPLFLLGDQFGSGPDPAAPYPDCGSTPDPADCVTFTSCP